MFYGCARGTAGGRSGLRENQYAAAGFSAGDHFTLRTAGVCFPKKPSAVCADYSAGEFHPGENTAKFLYWIVPLKQPESSHFTKIMTGTLLTLSLCFKVSAERQSISASSTSDSSSEILLKE